MPDLSVNTFVGVLLGVVPVLQVLYSRGLVRQAPTPACRCQLRYTLAQANFHQSLLLVKGTTASCISVQPRFFSAEPFQEPAAVAHLLTL
jgi:hypothetical protein